MQGDYGLPGSGGTDDATGSVEVAVNVFALCGMQEL
jgi:hypothetical protein